MANGSKCGRVGRLPMRLGALSSWTPERIALRAQLLLSPEARGHQHAGSMLGTSHRRRSLGTQSRGGPGPHVGPSLHYARPRRHGDTAELRALARAYGVGFRVFAAEEVDARARRHTIGYEIELTGSARPLLHAWYGGATASDIVQGALARIAEHALAHAEGPTACQHRLLPPIPSRAEGGPVRLRIGCYDHDHALASAPAREQPCVLALKESLAALAVWPDS